MGDGQAQPQDGQEDAEPGEPQQVTTRAGLGWAGLGWAGRCLVWAGRGLVTGYSCRLLDQGLVV